MFGKLRGLIRKHHASSAWDSDLDQVQSVSRKQMRELLAVQDANEFIQRVRSQITLRSL